MANNKVSCLGKISLIQSMEVEGVIFKGEETRLISNFSYDEEENFNNIYAIKYQIKSTGYYHNLFTIFHKPNKSRYTVYLKYRKSSVFNFIGEREEKLLAKLKKSDINEEYFEKSFGYCAINPIQFCTIPFLEDEVKDWILTAGQQTYSKKDFKTIAKSLLS